MTPTARRIMGVCFFAAPVLAAGLSGGCTAPREVSQPPVSRATEAEVAPGAGRVADIGWAASNAMNRITSARDALEEEQVTQAQELLEASLADMDHVFTWLPEESLYGAVDTAARQLEREEVEVDLGPLEEQLLAQREYLPTAAVADVQAARRLLREGRPAEALGRLREARQVLSRELLVLPLEVARSRIREAVRALENGQPAQALSWLDSVPELLDEVRVFSPLVPSRWQMRAAAAAAARGEWERAEALVRAAVENLESYRGTFDSPLTLQVERLEADARMLLRRMDGWSRPSPEYILWLAERMGPASAVGGSGLP